ncbi:MAG: hypothetical protein IMZ67_08430, partial [Acidobacteria bacterium]|nr:hypothetical protein [Acidobacteriota bacterium]
MTRAAEPAGVERTVTDPARRQSDLGRSLGGLVAVCLAAVVTLRALDALPGYLTGVPRGVTTAASLEAAERSLHARIWLPAVLPDSLRWPPDAITLSAGPPAAAAVTFLAADGSGARLIVCQTIGPADAPPPTLLPPGLNLETTRVPLRGRDASLSRVQLDNGRIVHDLA